MLLYKVKECLCDIPGAHPHECDRVLARAYDQNVQFLGVCQFFNNYKG